ncbi:MAG TPA: geranyl transferase [Xanthomonadales bacterium]|nr:geranyl transferase [Xanthomonadales bacterium]
MNAETQNTRERLDHWRNRVDAALLASLPDPSQEPTRLHRAMHHALLAGGKRLRPLLVYAAGHTCGATEDVLDAPAVAIELVHTYSLVHDDLPAMDDDDLRRGQPTVHVAFDEATAILTGDALLTLAFAVLAGGPGSAETRLAWVDALAESAGVVGMCGGQALDIAATGSQQPLEALNRMHALKTGALIRAAVRMGAIAGGADSHRLARLDDFADALGLAFQIRDDILDVEASSEQLGKTAGKDAAQNKSTYPALLGLDQSRHWLDRLAERMSQALTPFGPDADPLRALARLAIERGH